MVDPTTVPPPRSRPISFRRRLARRMRSSSRASRSGAEAGAPIERSASATVALARQSPIVAAHPVRDRPDAAVRQDEVMVLVRLAHAAGMGRRPGHGRRGGVGGPDAGGRAHRATLSGAPVKGS